MRLRSKGCCHILAGTLWCLGLAVRPAMAQIIPVDVIGSFGSYSEYSSGFNQTYKDWGNEPFVAVNPLSTNEVVVSGFGYGSPGANYYYSTNGGMTWGARFAVSSPVTGVTVPNDQVFAYDKNGRLHAIMLGSDNANRNNTNIYHGYTDNPNNDGKNGRPASNWTWTQNTAQGNAINANGRNSADQPWIAISGNNIFASYANFATVGSGVEERIVKSTDLGTTFGAGNDFAVSRNGQVSSTVNPGLRIATDALGNVYSVFGIGTADTGSVQTVTYRLNRNTDFTNANAGPGGLIIDGGQSAQFGSSFGNINQLQGNVTAIAVTQDGSHVYVVYGKKDGANVDRLYLAEFHSDGHGGLVERANPRVLSPAGLEAALPSVTVTANGTVAIEYDTFDAATSTFVIHYTTSGDNGLNFNDQAIDSFTTPGAPNTPEFPDQTRMLGDYQYLTSLGDTVFGTFAARGNVFTNVGGNITDTRGNIDPFYFSVTFASPEPGTVTLLCSIGIVGVNTFVRRRRSRSAFRTLKEATPIRNPMNPVSSDSLDSGV